MLMISVRLLILFLLASSFTASLAQLNLLGRICDIRSRFDGLNVVGPLNGSTVDYAKIEIKLQLNIKNAGVVDAAIKESRFCLTVFSLPSQQQRWHKCGYKITNPLFLTVQTGWQELVVSIKNIDTQIVECKTSTTIHAIRNGWDGCYHKDEPIVFNESSLDTSIIANPFMKPIPNYGSLVSDKPIDDTSRPTLLVDIFVSVPFLLFDRDRHMNVNIGDTTVKMHSNFIPAFDWLRQQIALIVDEFENKKANCVLNTHFVLMRNYDIPTNQSEDDSSSSFNEYSFHSWAEWIVDLFQGLSSVLVYDCPYGVDCTVPTAARLTRTEDATYVFVSINEYLTKNRALLDLIRMMERTTVCIAVSNNPALLHRLPRNKLYLGSNHGRQTYSLVDYEPDDGTQWLLFDAKSSIYYWNVLELMHSLQKTSKSSSITLPFIATRAGCVQLFYSNLSSESSSTATDNQWSPVSYVLKYLIRYPQASLVFPMPNVVKKKIFTNECGVDLDSLCLL